LLTSLVQFKSKVLGLTAAASLICPQKSPGPIFEIHKAYDYPNGVRLIPIAPLCIDMKGEKTPFDTVDECPVCKSHTEVIKLGAEPAREVCFCHQWEGRTLE